MTSPFQLLAQEEYSQNPDSGMKNPYSSPFEELASSEENQEPFLKINSAFLKKIYIANTIVYAIRQ